MQGGDPYEMWRVTVTPPFLAYFPYFEQTE
jgi:hypothetical protein